MENAFCTRINSAYLRYTARGHGKENVGLVQRNRDSGRATTELLVDFKEKMIDESCAKVFWLVVNNVKTFLRKLHLKIVKNSIWYQLKCGS